MRLLITGAGGMLGQDVARAASGAGHEVRSVAHADLDITDRARVEAIVSETRPDAVINCAAWTDVDGAENSPDAAFEVNGSGAGNVARSAASAGAWTIHVSTDYVFDGSKREPYVESDPTKPLSVYGRSKLAGEAEVAKQASALHTIVRSSWLFGTGGPCFPATMIRLAGERDELTVVDGQVGSPTFTGHLAPALVELAGNKSGGILHVAGAGSCSWFEFARAIVEATELRCEIKPGGAAEPGRPAARPLYSVLGTERGAEAPRLPDWRQGLAEYLAARVAA